MNDIKIYEKLFRIKFKEQEFYLAEWAFKKFKENMVKPWNIIEMWENLYNKYDFQYTEEYKPSNDIEKFILQQPNAIKKALIQREKEKKEKVWRWFDSIDEVNNRIMKKDLYNNL